MRQVCALVLLGLACDQGSVEPPPPGQAFPHDAPPVSWFREVTAGAGLDTAVHRAYPTDDLGKAAGIAAADLDGDGALDLAIAGGEGPVRVFRNLGGLRFTEVTAELGIDPAVRVRAVAFADIDRDGDPDLVTVGADGARLHENAGDRLVDITASAGISAGDCPLGILPLDIDRDGWVDLLFVEALFDPFGDPPQGHLWRNRGDGTFENVWDQVGLRSGAHTWVVSASDFDGDGDIDLYFGNDTFTADTGERPLPPPQSNTHPPDWLYRNRGAAPGQLPVFEEVGASAGIREHRSNMGVLAADFTGDGRDDYFVSDWGQNDLLAATGDGSFMERTAEYSLDVNRRFDSECDCLLVSWGAVFEDLDHDGRRDLVVVNSALPGGPATQPATVWRGVDGAGFQAVQTDLGWLPGRALLAADLDGDGDLDLVVTGWESAPRLFENIGANGPWLSVALRGLTSNPTGLGARVTVQGADGVAQTRTVGTGGVVHSWGPDELHFGLGAAGPARVTVHWPSGGVQTVELAEVEMRVEIEEQP